MIVSNDAFELRVYLAYVVLVLKGTAIYKEDQKVTHSRHGYSLLLAN